MGPFLRSKNSTNKIMLHLLVALLPIIIFTVYKNGYIPYSNGLISFIEMFNPLLTIFIGALTSFVVESIYALILKKKNYIKNSYAFFPGLFLALILPLHTPIYVVVIGSVVASISKIIFGGFGKNMFNPALVGYLFIILVFSSILTTDNYFNQYELDTISSPTPLTNASMVSGIGSYDELVEPYGDLSNFLIGTIPGSLAETSALLCIVAYIYLSFTKTIKWRIPLVYVATVFIITFGIGRLLGEGIYYPLFHILSGGLMFGAVFMATDPITSCVTPIGQVLQGILLGIITVIFRFTGVEGVAYSILIVNALVFLLDKIGMVSRFNLLKSIIWFVIVWIIVIALTVILAASRRVEGNKDPNFDITSKEESGNQTIYNVSQEGYGGKIRAKVIIENDRIVSLEITSHHETANRYQLVLDSDYINQLINNQDNLDGLDTVSSATVTSNALKKLVINVLEDYKPN